MKAESRIEHEVRELIRLRDPNQDQRNRLPLLPILKAWQQKRLALSFKELLDNPRHAKAARFFLDELYGDFDLRTRDQDLARMAPTLRRFLPEHAQDALADAIELDALSHRLDLELTEALPRGLRLLDVAAYARAYTAADDGHSRDRQLLLIDHVGQQLDRLVHQFWLGPVIKMARVPAEMMGIGSLHRFLVNGLDAFRAMNGAEEFLQTIGARERSAKAKMLNGSDNPFGFELTMKVDVAN